MPLKRRTLLVTAGATAAALVAGGTTAALAAGTAPTVPASTSTSTPARTPCAPGARGLLRALPRSLRTDLRHLAKDSAADRAADRAAIEKKALAGGYGVRIERVARIVAGEHGGFAAALPPSLRDDLKTLRADPRGSAARRAEAATIWSKALAGAYGANIETLAKDAKTRVDQRCAAEHPSGPGS